MRMWVFQLFVCVASVQLYGQENQLVEAGQVSTVKSEPRSVVGISVARLVMLRGEPLSRLTAGGKESLFYSDFIYTAEAGRVTEVRQRRQHSVGAGTQVVTRQEANTHVSSSQSLVAEGEEALKARLIKSAEPKVQEWAQQMTRNTGEWYSERYYQSYESCTPVAGWPNRYCLIGHVNVFSQRRNATLRFEALVQLEEAGQVKGVEITLRH